MKKTENIYKEYLDNLPEDAQAIADYTNFDSEYIQDIIHEIADNAVPIYYNSLLQWLNDDRDAVEYIEEAAGEFGLEKPFDFWRTLSLGYYIKAEREINANLEDTLKCWAYCYIWKQLKIEELTDSQVEEIEDIDYQGADQFDDIIEEIKNILEIKGE